MITVFEFGTLLKTISSIIYSINFHFQSNKVHQVSNNLLNPFLIFLFQACSLCNKSFITSSELTRHMSKHRGIKNFKCELCGSAYIHSRDLVSKKIEHYEFVTEIK